MKALKFEPAENKYTASQIKRAQMITGDCICSPAYSDRGLAQHDCSWCDHGEEVLALIANNDNLIEERENLLDLLCHISSCPANMMCADCEEQIDGELKKAEYI